MNESSNHEPIPFCDGSGQDACVACSEREDKCVPFPCEEVHRIIDVLVQHGCFAADSVSFSLEGVGVSKAELVRRQLTAALRMLVGNDVIRITPLSEWPEYVVLDPPYRMPK